jgi:hypothetical protein
MLAAIGAGGPAIERVAPAFRREAKDEAERAAALYNSRGQAWIAR